MTDILPTAEDIKQLRKKNGTHSKRDSSVIWNLIELLATERIK